MLVRADLSRPVRDRKVLLIDDVFDSGRTLSFARSHLMAKGALDVDQLNTVYLVDSEGVHARSDAVLRIARQLRPPWRWLAVCLMIPRPVRDAVYRLIGRLRYALFGRSAYCAVATPAVQDRFLATDERDQTPR